MSRLLDECICEVLSVNTEWGLRKNLELIDYDREFLLFRDRHEKGSSIITIPRSQLRSLEYEEDGNECKLDKRIQRKNSKVFNRNPASKGVQKDRECKGTVAAKRVDEEKAESKGSRNP